MFFNLALTFYLQATTEHTGILLPLDFILRF